MVKWFLIAVLAFLVAEVTVFIAVSSLIGLPQAFLLMVTISFAGVAVMRYPGRGRLDRMHDAVSKGGISGLEAGGDAFLTVAAGILLLLPGFITDVAGLLLLLPPVRQWIGGRLQNYLQTRQTGPSVVDLDRGEWNQVPEREIEDRQPKSGPP
jgi:UPF0716 protein FxsA